jgi:REP element-mobilizing transposase RayT
MARKHRIEYEGACYHVINRGNYRTWVFKEEGAKDAFEQCLAEAATRCGWRVHAWVVMGNHFHLAVETPKASLSAGMQWLLHNVAHSYTAQYHLSNDIRSNLKLLNRKSITQSKTKRNFCIASTISSFFSTSFSGTTNKACLPHVSIGLTKFSTK